MGVRLKAEFHSDQNNLYKIEIHDSTWAAAAYTFNVDGTGFQLSYTGETDDIVSPIVGSNVTVNAYNEDAQFDSFISDLTEHQENRFRIVIYKDSVFYWAGWIMQDLVRVDDSSKPYIYSITAADGFAKISNTDYDNANDISQSDGISLTRLTDIIINALKDTGLDDLWGATDKFLEVAVDWWETTSHTYSTTDDPLYLTGVDTSIFETKEDDGSIIYTSGLGVLKQLATLFNARIYQANGRFVFEQYGVRAASTRYIHTYDKSGTEVTDETISDEVTLDQTISGGARLAGNEFNYLPAMKRAEVVYNQKFLSPWYSGFTFDDTNSSFSPGFISTGTGIDLLLWGPLVYQLIDSNRDTANDTTAFAPVFKTQIKLEDSSNPGTYYYYTNTYNNGFASLSPIWTTTAGYFYSKSTMTTVVEGHASSSLNTHIATTQLPVSGLLTVTVDVSDYWDYAAGAAYTLATGQSDSWTFHALFSRTDHGIQPAEGVTYVSNNASTDIESNTTLELGNLIIADGPYASGGLAVYNGTKWVAAFGWRKGSTGTGKGILSLLVFEALALHYRPVKQYEGAIVTDANFQPVIGFDSENYLRMGGTFNANEEQWDSQYFLISRDATNIGDLDPEPSDRTPPNGAVGTTGSTNEPGFMNGGRIAGMDIGLADEKIGPFQQVTGGAAIVGGLKDGEGSFGTSGQVLSSTVTGLSWITSASSNDYVTGMTFNTSDGIVTLTRSGGLADITTDLDGRYLTTHPAIPNSGSIDNSNGVVVQDITIDAYGHSTAWGTVDLDTRFLKLAGGTMTGELTVTGKLHGITAGTANTDAVNVQQLNNATTGVLVYQGVWNAATNTPTLTSATGTIGGYYIVSVDGTTNLDGITDWKVGDWAVFSDMPTDAWQKIDNTSILGGAGTGGNIAAWSGSGTSVTLTDAPITYSGSNTTFGGKVYATEYDLPSGGILDWANGDARIAEGLVNNYSLSFQTWDGTNVSTALRLDGNNDATFAGTITATGGTSTQWNTAYTYSTVGHLPLAGGTLTGNVVFSNNTELRWKDNGGTERTVLELDSSNNLYLGKSGGGTVNIVSGTSYTTAASFDSAQNATFAGTIQSDDITIVDGTNDVNLNLANTSYGIRLDYSTGDMFLRTNGATRLTIANGGAATFAGTIAASNLSGTNTGDQDLSPYAPLASPTFTGSPRSVTPATASNDTSVATTAYVKAQGYSTAAGTVTSVAMTVPTGLTVSGTPITASGTLAVVFASGYSIPTNTGQSNWNTAYTYSTVGHLPLAGGTLTGHLTLSNTYAPSNFAELNIGSAGSGETRAIDILGSWSANENKSISFTHGSSAANMVAQINALYTGSSSKIRWGRLYHGGDSSAYVMELLSTSSTTANLTVSGNISATGGTSTQWNTAYGWGDHAGLYLRLAGDTMAGTIEMDGNTVSDGIFVTQGGTSDDFVKGDGSLDSTAYLPLAGGTMTGTSGVLFPDNFNLKIGTGSDLKLFHNATDSFIINEVGDLKITNGANDKDIIFESDNGSGGTTPYLQLDGSHTRSIAWKDLHFVDGIKAKFGDYASPDLQIYHDGSNSYIQDTGTGTLNLQGSTQVIIGGINGHVGVQYVEGAGVNLRHNNVQKLATTSTGVSVTGLMQASTVGVTNIVTNKVVKFNGSILDDSNITDTGSLITLGSAVTATGTVTSPTFLGDLSGTINTATTAVTQAASNNSTKVATTAYADAAAAAVPVGDYLPLAGGTMSGDVDMGGNRITDGVFVTQSGTSDDFVKGDGTLDSTAYLALTGGTLSGALTGTAATFSGDVGIGTTAPGAKLHVESTVATGANFILETTHTGGIPLLDLKGAHSAQVRYKDELDVIQGRIDFGDSGTFNFIDVPNNNSTLYLKTGGNVGIGTTAPVGKLEVVTTDANRYIRFKAPNGEERFQFYTGGTGNPAAQHMYSSDGTTKNVQISAGGTSYLNGGNVGIGLTAPQSKLQVDGGIQMADDTDTASASKVGTQRYRTSGNNSYVDMCMQTGATTYEWINILENNW